MIEWFIAWLSLQRDDYPQRKLQLNQQVFSETLKQWFLPVFLSATSNSFTKYSIPIENIFF